MRRQQRRLGYVVFFSLLIAFTLAILPLPHFLAALRPAWVLLVLAYWAMAMPERISVGLAWCCGLLLDVLLSTALGLHALAMVVLIYLVNRFHRQLRVFPVWQQAMVMALLLLCQQALIFWIQTLLHHSPSGVGFWFAAPVGALFWPGIFALLRHERRRWQS